MAEGEAILLPKKEVTVVWDPETQMVGLRFSPQDFKTFEFLASILDQAKREVLKQVDAAVRAQIAARLLEAQQQVQQEDRIRDEISRSLTANSFRT